MNHNPGDIQYSLLSIDNPKSPLNPSPSLDSFDILRNTSFHRGMKIIVVILIMIGLMIDKLWMTVREVFKILSISKPF